MRTRSHAAYTRLRRLGTDARTCALDAGQSAVATDLLLVSAMAVAVAATVAIAYSSCLDSRITHVWIQRMRRGGPLRCVDPAQHQSMHHQTSTVTALRIELSAMGHALRGGVAAVDGAVGDEHMPGYAISCYRCMCSLCARLSVCTARQCEVSCTYKQTTLHCHWID